MVKKSENLKKSQKITFFRFFFIFENFFFSPKKKNKMLSSQFSNIRRTQFDQSSPVHPVSESRGGPLSVTEEDGRTDGRRKSSCLIQDTIPLQNCIGPTFCISQESWCLPYAGFFIILVSIVVQCNVLYYTGRYNTVLHFFHVEFGYNGFAIIIINPVIYPCSLHPSKPQHIIKTITSHFHSLCQRTARNTGQSWFLSPISGV